MTEETVTPAIDVRRIVLAVVDGNAEARQAYLTEPAMRYGIEVTIGVLGRVAQALTGTAGMTRDQAEVLIHEIVLRCSVSGAQHDQQGLAAANRELFGGHR